MISDVPVLGTAAATMAPVTKFAWETLGGFAKGAGDFVGGLGHMAAHPSTRSRAWPPWPSTEVDPNFQTTR